MTLVIALNFNEETSSIKLEEQGELKRNVHEIYGLLLKESILEIRPTWWVIHLIKFPSRCYSIPMIKCVVVDHVIALLHEVNFAFRIFSSLNPNPKESFVDRLPKPTKNEPG